MVLQIKAMTRPIPSSWSEAATQNRAVRSAAELHSCSRLSEIGRSRTSRRARAPASKRLYMRSLCTIRSHYVACSGQRVYMYFFNVSERRWQELCEPHMLASTGTFITICRPFIHITTGRRFSRDSSIPTGWRDWKTYRRQYSTPGSECSQPYQPEYQLEC